ncbi:hypothetical protein GCM10027586_00750 [Kineococcus gypseus]|uniref:phage tail tape measure protein n=1 Tax=Kineococcus gypseus TaxID=1637102 RepID=UPI003D7EF5DA
MATAAVAGSIEYLIGADDSQLVRTLQSLPQTVARAGSGASQAAQRVGAQAGGALSTALAAQLGQQLHSLLRQRITMASRSLPDIEVGTDTSSVDRGLADVRRRLAQLQSQEIGVDLDAEQAQRQIGELLADLRQVAAQSPDIAVRTSAEQAIAQLSEVRAAVRELPDGRLRVDVDTDEVRAALRRLGQDVADEAHDAGEEAGQGITEGLSDGVAEVGSKTGPIVQAVLGAVSLVAGLAPGALLWKAIQGGMEQEASRGLFTAQTGLDPASVGRFARAAGESYAQNFGASVEDNLEAARQALGSGLLGGDATQAQITGLVNELQTVAQVLGEEVPAVARSAGQAIRVGLVADATGAFDLITRAQQNGLNVAEDLLDTIDEYGTQFRKLGLDGTASFGLIQQAVRAGARDVDIAADALKEFSIRAIDGSELTVGSFDALGLSAQQMQQRIAAGGDSAAAALDETLDRLREVEDPSERAAIAVGLFGTQAEDLGQALYAMDLSSAREEFGATAGAIEQAMADIGTNTAGQIETARRAIDTAAQGVQGALAAAFGPELGRAADWVSANRAAVTEFAFDASRGFLEFVRVVATGTADGLDVLAAWTPAMRELGLQVIGFAAAANRAWGDLPFTDNAQADETARNLAQLGVTFSTSMDAVGAASELAADGIRANVLPAVDAAQERFDAMAIPAMAQARFSDATMALGRGLDDVATHAQATQGAVDRLTGTVDLSTEAGRELDGRLRGVAAAMLDQAQQGQLLGQSQEELSGRFREGRDALVQQLMQLGLTREAADRLTTSYGLVPGAVDTIVSDRGTADAVRGQVEDLNAEIRNIKDRTVTIKAMLTGVTPDIVGGRPAATGAGGNGGQVASRAQGGPVWGAGTATSDSIDARLSNGEHVWTAAEVTAAGGQDRVHQLRRAALAGELPAFALGGAVGDTTTIKMPSARSVNDAHNSVLRSFAGVAQQAQDAIDAALRAAAESADSPGAYTGPLGAGSGGQGWQWQIATLRQIFPGLHLNSGFRRGAVTSSGNLSYHARGRAVDVPPRMDVFNWLLENFGATSKEIIFSPAGNRQIKNGRPHYYTGKVRADHFDHVHWAFRNGGPVLGPGTGTSDSIRASLSQGEHVWTAREVQAAGGHGAVEGLRAAVRGYAAGGTVTAGGRSVGGYDLPRYLTGAIAPARTRVDDSDARAASFDAVQWASRLAMAEAALALAKTSDEQATDRLRNAETSASSARREAESATERQTGIEERLTKAKEAQAEAIADAQKALDKAKGKADNAEGITSAEERLAEVREDQGKRVAEVEAELEQARSEVRRTTQGVIVTQRILTSEQELAARAAGALADAESRTASIRVTSEQATERERAALEALNAAKAEALAYAQRIAQTATSGAGITGLFTGADQPRDAQYARQAYDAAVAQARQAREADDLQGALDAVASAGAKVAQTQQAMGASYATVSGTLSATRAQVEELARSYGFSASEARKLAESSVPLANTGQTLVESLTRQLTAVQGFSRSIEQLRKLGLSQSLIDQVLDAGPGQGSQLAESILAGGSTLVGQLNAVQGQLEKAARGLGVSAAGAAYGAPTRGGLPRTGAADPGITVPRGGRSVRPGALTVTPTKVEVNMRNEFTVTDASMAAVVARQQRLELRGALSSVGV